MIKAIKYIILPMLLLISKQLTAQYYETGQDPAVLKWEIIKTDHFRFIYPVTYRQDAIRAGRIYEDAWKLISSEVPKNRSLRRFPVIFHNYSIESNGYVAWAPRRMELYPLSPQDNLPMDHHHQLALHELTHVLQMESLTSGISRPLSWLLGEQYTGALAIFTPYWLLEGNAVINETRYSLSGRGRSPDFEKELKALLLEGEGKYSFSRMLHGSYRDYTPDYYQFGYQMSVWGMALFNRDIWNDALRFTSKAPFSLNPVNFSLRRNYSTTKNRLYHTTMNTLDSIWRSREKEMLFTSFDTVNNTLKREYTSYLSPVAINENSIAAVKTGLSRTPSIVLIDRKSGRERVLHRPGYMQPSRISASMELITWAEIRKDPRWSNRGFSIIKIINRLNGDVRTLTHRTRYFSPALSGDASRIVVVESRPDNRNSLVVLSAASGEILKQVPLPGNIMAQFPAWAPDDSVIVFISHSGEGEGIMTLDHDLANFTTIIPQQVENLESVAMTGDTILYTSSVSGITNIYAITPDGERFRLTSSRFGVSDISVRDNMITFSDYSSSGSNAGIIDSYRERLTAELPAPFTTPQVTLTDSPVKLAEHSTPDSSKFIPGPYRKGLHLFNFHSWMPFWSDINNISTDNLNVSPGVTLHSQNHLSTMISSVGYEYLDGDHLLHSTIAWKGWYPVFELDMTYGGTPAIIQNSSNTSEPSVLNPGLFASGTVYLPLQFNRGRFNRTLWPQARVSYTNNYFYESETGLYDYGQTLLSARLFFSNTHRMAYRDIWPRWGQVIDLNTRFSPSDPDLYGPVTSAKALFYFPGIIRNHGLKITLQHEQKEFRKLLTGNRITLPRGYINVIPEKISAFSADYTLPLLYPDLGIGQLIYIQRLRGELFYDYAIAEENYYYLEENLISGSEEFISYGSGLMADFYLLRIPFRFTAGVEAAWLPVKNEPWINYLFKIDVFGFVLNRENPGGW
ncbi:MAG: hypothetical protein LC649_07605 [Bacteroidales bacterium]|nr:hypothetical protein [Bacteroidales bacterium]